MSFPADRLPSPFSRGFLLWPSLDKLPDGKIPEEWKVSDIGGYYFFYDSLTEVRKFSSGNVEVLILGSVLDVRSPSTSTSRILEKICDSVDIDVKNGLENFPNVAEALKPLAGSFIVIFSHGSKVNLTLDAVGTFPACYKVVKNGAVVASHPTLLAEIFDLEPTKKAIDWMNHKAANAGGRYMPGLLTMYPETFNVVANHYFNINTGDFLRYFPDSHHKTKSTEEIVEMVAPLLSDQLSELSKNKNIIIGLSGGLDSRLTLAASRSVKERVSYFTYYSENNEILSNDIEIAKNLASHLGLNHFSFPAWGGGANEELKKIWLRSTGGVRGPIGVNAQFIKNISQESLHIRSNILEAVRGFYSRNPANRGADFSAKKLSRLFRVATANDFEIDFQDFMRATSFKPESLKGYHYTDLFYWEHRMSCWLGPMIRDNRLSHDTHIIYNCRLILEAMMAQSMDDRNSAKVIVGLIKHMWPEVLDIPVYSGSKFIDVK